MNKMVETLPIYNAVIDDEQCGINKISLVQSPAVESYFVAFSKEKKQILFTVNEEQKMITGVIMRCDYPIYRCDSHLGEFYINFNAETIKIMAQKLLRDDNQNRVNIEHLFNSDVQGVEMVELFIKDVEKGKNPKGFEDISNGSLFATFKVENHEIWQKIRSGEFKGFSLEGDFSLIIPENETEDKPTDEYDEIDNLLEQIKEKIKNLK